MTLHEDYTLAECSVSHKRRPTFELVSVTVALVSGPLTVHVSFKPHMSTGVVAGGEGDEVVSLDICTQQAYAHSPHAHESSRGGGEKEVCVHGEGRTWAAPPPLGDVTKVRSPTTRTDQWSTH